MIDLAPLYAAWLAVMALSWLSLAATLTAWEIDTEEAR